VPYPVLPPRPTHASFAETRSAGSRRSGGRVRPLPVRQIPHRPRLSSSGSWPGVPVGGWSRLCATSDAHRLPDLRTLRMRCRLARWSWSRRAGVTWPTRRRRPPPTRNVRKSADVPRPSRDATSWLVAGSNCVRGPPFGWFDGKAGTGKRSFDVLGVPHTEGRGRRVSSAFGLDGCRRRWNLGSGRMLGLRVELHAGLG